MDSAHFSQESKFKREEENFVSAHEIDHLSLIVPSGGSLAPSINRSRTQTNGRSESSSLKPGKIYRLR
ncbi:unnamed protein product [Trichobilharzia regenti]|nr:unnamed protein product [Trichobilharzia regenti]